MAERPVILEGRNLALVMLNGFLMVASTLLWFGPGASELARKEAKVAELLQRTEAWERRAAASRPPRQSELEQWAQEYYLLATHGFEHGDDSVLIGRLANWISAPGITRLDITAIPHQDEDARQGEIVVRDTDGEQARVLREIPMRARFQTNYRAFSQLMARLSDPQAPIEVRRLEATRQYPNIKVDLQLALWTHSEDFE